MTIAIKTGTMSFHNIEALYDSSISWGARGILQFLYLQCRKMASGETIKKYSNEDISGYLYELEQAGYIGIYRDEKIKLSA